MYQNVDHEVANKAIASMKRHLWYLVPELVSLALFDKEVSPDEKQLIAVTLLNTPKPAHFTPGKPGQPAFQPIIAKLQGPKPLLSLFVTERTWLMFELARPYFDITSPEAGQHHTAVAPVIAESLAWLSEDPIIWPDYEEYIRLQLWVSQLEVTNDATEQGVKMHRRSRRYQETHATEKMLCWS